MSEAFDAGMAVRAINLRKTFPSPAGGGLHALNNISLDIRSGELTALVGPDGVGKTTLMRMMAGLLPADSGSLVVLGEDVLRHPQKVQDRISYMPQRFGLYEDLSIQENLDLYADLHGVPDEFRRKRFARLLAMTDLANFTSRTAGKLSGGMKQKLGLACTLVRLPDLLLLDEPSVGVDPLSRRDLWRIVMQLVREEQLCVVVSTAYMDEAEQCANVFVMHEGNLLASGSPSSLRERVRGLTFSVHPGPTQSTRALQTKLLDATREVIDAIPRAGGVNFIRSWESTDREMKKLLGNLEVKPREATFEDAFMMALATQRERRVTSFARNFEAVCPRPVETERPAIRVENLVRRFADFTAVASTSFSVSRGEIFGLLGPNGAGKTTTFRMLCGLLAATSGFLEVAGMNLRTARAQARARIGYVSQKFALYGNLSVRENLAFFGGVYGLRGKKLKERIAQVMEQFQLMPTAKSGFLPGGYKQRLAMAVALIHEPEILFLDEPTSGIDPLARRAFWRTITALAQTGVTVVITTHFMEEAEYCDRIAIQDAGKMLALGTPEEVRKSCSDDENIDMDDAFIAIVEHARSLKATPQKETE